MVVRICIVEEQVSLLLGMLAGALWVGGGFDRVKDEEEEEITFISRHSCCSDVFFTASQTKTLSSLGSFLHFGLHRGRYGMCVCVCVSFLWIIFKHNQPQWQEKTIQLLESYGGLKV